MSYFWNILGSWWSPPATTAASVDTPQQQNIVPKNDENREQVQSESSTKQQPVIVAIEKVENKIGVEIDKLPVKVSVEEKIVEKPTIEQPDESISEAIKEKYANEKFEEVEEPETKKPTVDTSVDEETVDDVPEVQRQSGQLQHLNRSRPPPGRRLRPQPSRQHLKTMKSLGVARPSLSDLKVLGDAQNTLETEGAEEKSNASSESLNSVEEAVAPRKVMPRGPAGIAMPGLAGFDPSKVLLKKTNSTATNTAEAKGDVQLQQTDFRSALKKRS